MVEDSGVKGRIKRFLKSCRCSSFVTDYLFASNIRSAIFVSVIVAVMEIWMLIMMFSGVIKNSNNYTISWLLTHTAAYGILLISSIIMLVYSVLYLKNRISNKKIGYVIKLFFSVIMMLFGLYISYTSKDRGGQVFAFITVVIIVNCIFVWHPVISFTALTAVFLVYIFLQNKLVPLTLSIKVNAFTTWLAFFITALNSHHQKRVEAQKDEELNSLNLCLEQKSLIDELTSLPNMNYFYKTVGDFIKDENNSVENMCFAFMDVENFKSYNEKYGFAAGTDFIKTVAQIINEVFAGEITARFSDDHFVAFTDITKIKEKAAVVNERIHGQENLLQLELKVGIYKLKGRHDSPNLACDHARYACESIKKHFGRSVVEYDDKMDKLFNQKQYIINNIDSAIEKGFIKVFYQPVVWAATGKICGVEALARWEDPVFGFLSPASFIPVLEEYHLIHKLDVAVMEIACRDLREALDVSFPAVPVSINLSRLDFELIDPAKELDRCIEKYGLSKSYIHVEITESALSSSDEKLKMSLELFHKNGNTLWLDDFGSGYSGLNVLKDYSFDLMKIDMAFLSEFSENDKAQPILTSIINLANQIGMQTLTEGVETQEAYDFLKSIGCLRLQGYLFGKPMPKEEFTSKVNSGFYQV
ncbi:EAL domain-containing protein [Treponema sp.]|uniref:EAL domain-containing protein n=1 Tax=Treponema sp. TaxID=166 RepID=UPI00257A19B0|nr:EAL domain-containing protein [Treponema sp.]MBE6354899.1 EAL domain-containing protein [Treponema sp.]